MRLKDYLDKPKNTASALAVKCKCSVSTISRVADGLGNPTLDLLIAIELHTDGAVSLRDLAAARCEHIASQE